MTLDAGERLSLVALRTDRSETLPVPQAASARRLEMKQANENDRLGVRVVFYHRRTVAIGAGQGAGAHGADVTSRILGGAKPYRIRGPPRHRPGERGRITNVAGVRLMPITGAACS